MNKQRKPSSTFQKKQHAAISAASVQGKNSALPFIQQGVALPKWVYGLILALVFAFYGNTLFNHYALDDTMVITQNEFVKRGVSNIPKILKYDTFNGRYGTVAINLPGGRYRPLSVITLALEYELFTDAETKQIIQDKLDQGKNDDDAALLVETPLPYVNHLVNILLYAITAWVLLLIMLRLFPLESTTGWRALFNIPVLTVIFFVAHPVHSEVVANIKGRDEIMTLLGALCALYFTLRWLDTKKLSDMIYAFLAFLLGLFSKENAITFLVVIPITMYLIKPCSMKFMICSLLSAVLVFPFFKGNAGLFFVAAIPLLVCLFISEKDKRYTMAMLPLYLAAFIFLLARQSAINLDPPPEKELMNNPFMYMLPGQKWASIIYVLGRYLWLQIFPYPLTTDYYPYHIPIMSFSDVSVILITLFYVALGAFTFWGVFKRNKYAYAVVWFIVPLSIVSNIFVQVGTFMNERFIYISSIGFCMVLADFLIYQLPKWLKQKTLYQGVVACFMLVLLCLYGADTVARNKAWHDDFTLSTTDVKTSPKSAKANYDAARVYNIEMQTATDSTVRDSITRLINKYSRRAVEIHPNYENALLLLSWSNGALGQPPDSSIKYLLRLIRWNKHNPFALDALTMATSNYPNVEQKVKIWEYVAKLVPDRFEPNFNMALIYAGLGRFQDALPYFEKAVKINPEHAQALMGAGAMYANTEKFGKSVEMFERAAKLTPNDTLVYINLWRTYSSVGDGAKAQDALNKYWALKATPPAQ
ncbi:MAG: tetratricopeptide repeat protein [Prevotellaceae bacterium]|jgi:tetratricopeptide (TPR) repeat protein|nr:tetratricopeptide repeat protein [Prevotellaceae bacterium]